MSWGKRFRCLGLMAAWPLVCLLSGCDASHARFAPTSDEAKSSLEAALTAWRDGKPYGSAVESKPPVQVTDSAWQAGLQLESFAIGEEKDEGDATKQFTVTLKMKKPPGDESVPYYVHGRDPVWVYREEDYKRMINMDNNPVPASSSKSAKRRSGRER
jgi:hypothetical protein